MKIELEIYGSLCSCKQFQVNGIDAEKEDFGEQFDASPEDAEDYGCGNMVFERRAPTDEVLTKYGITEQQYNEIASKLEEGLSFGSCGWCV